MRIYIGVFGVMKSEILNENVMAAVRMKARGIQAAARRSVLRLRVGFEDQGRILIRCYLSTRHQSHISGVTGLESGWTRVTGRPSSWRALMNDVNASPVSPTTEYVSDCSSGNSSI